MDTAIDSVGTAITAGVADFSAAAPGVIAAGIGIGLLFWGAPRLFRLFKKTTS